MCNKLSYFFLLSVLFVSCKNEYKPDISTVRTSKGTEVFQPDSASIASHYKIPDWFSDSKFGIFIHWGPASVPAYDGWYARNMYDVNSHVINIMLRRMARLRNLASKNLSRCLRLKNLIRKHGRVYLRKREHVMWFLLQSIMMDLRFITARLTPGIQLRWALKEIL